MRNRFIAKISEGRKNIFKLSSGTMLGHIISIISLPIIVLLYDVETIGLLTLVMSIAVLVKSISDIGLTNSLMTEEDTNLERTYKVITTVNFIISFFTSWLITLFLFYFLNWNNFSFFVLLFFLFCIIFTTQQIQVCYTWLNRKMQYNILMLNPLINHGIFNITAIILGFLHGGIYSYFISYILGQFITLLHMYRKTPKRLLTLNIRYFKETIINNKTFIQFQIPTNILMNLKNHIPTIIIQSFWGSQMLGYYSITVKILQVPSSLLASAIGRVFFQTISRMHREGKEIGQYVMRNLTNGMKIAIIPMFLLMAFGDYIIIMFFGNDWEVAGNFIQILSLMYFFSFLMNTLQGLAITLKKQKFTMMLSIFQIVGHIVGAFIGEYFFHSIYIGLFCMSLFYIIIQVYYFSALFKVMGVPVKRYIVNVVLSVLVLILSSLLIRIIYDYIKHLLFK